MNARINAVLRTDKKKGNGLIPIYVKVRVNGKEQYKSTKCFTEESYWDKKNESVSDKHHDHANVNKAIMGLKTKLQNEATRQMIDGTGNGITTTGIIAKAEKVDSKGKVNFFKVVREEVKYRKAHPDDYAPRTITNYNKVLNRLAEYHGDETLCFEDITVDWLKKLHTDVTEEGLAPNYINTIFRMIRTFVNMGIKKEVITYYPFKAFKMPKTEKAEKAKLTEDELTALEKIIPQLNKTQEQAVVYFLFGCYSGLRVSDWSRFNADVHLDNDGLSLPTKKTKTWMFVPYHPQLRRILKLVKALPLTISDVMINREIKLVAAELGINKKLTTHCARKTFAVTICSDNKISCEVCASMMGITVQVCMMNYYRVTKGRVKVEVTEALKNKK